MPRHKSELSSLRSLLYALALVLNVKRLYSYKEESSSWKSISAKRSWVR